MLDEETEELTLSKTSSTPDDFSQGVIACIQRTTPDMSKVHFFAHGSTVVINTILEGKGVKTGLITTRGFRDVLEIARGTRPDLYNLYYAKPKPLVSRRLRLEADERIDYTGKVLRPLSTEDVKRAAEFFRKEDVRAIAVCMLHSYANSTHEDSADRIIRETYPGVHVSLSHDIAAEWKEYERTNTTVLNAYVQPKTSTYIHELRENLRKLGFKHEFYVLRSNGGMMTSQQAEVKPIFIMESGPVAGVMGTAYLAEALGYTDVISFDMGGTTAKTSLLRDGKPNIVSEYRIGGRPDWPGYPIKAAVVDIIEIGAGGGSVAWVDEGGALRVGPQSTGADPGPACYGKVGTEATVTDANLVLGRINPDYFLGGEIKLDYGAAEQAINKLAGKIGLSSVDTAIGIVKIADSAMVGAAKVVSVQRGHDPRGFAMVAFGGGGPLHAASMAKDLGVPKVVVPVAPAHFSAWGMLVIDLRHDFAQTMVVLLGSLDPKAVSKTYERMENDGLATLLKEGMDQSSIRFVRSADLRYLGQEHSVSISIPNGEWTPDVMAEIERRFHEAHLRLYTFELKHLSVQIVSLRVTAFGITDKPALKRRKGPGSDVGGAVKVVRGVYFEEANEFLDCPVYERNLLPVGVSIEGPAVIEEAASTTVVHLYQKLAVDEYGNLIIDTKSDSSPNPPRRRAN